MFAFMPVHFSLCTVWSRLITNYFLNLVCFGFSEKKEKKRKISSLFMARGLSPSPSLSGPGPFSFFCYRGLVPQLSPPLTLSSPGW